MTPAEAPRVIEATVRAFVCAYASYAEAPLCLGEVVAVREGPFPVFGVVADVESGPDDPTRPLQPRGAPGQSANDVLDENPELRLLLRTRLQVVACGHVDREQLRPQVPPSPPPLLARVEAASDAEVVRLVADATFLSALVAAPACDDAVIAAAIRLAARHFGTEARSFTVAAGKELARLLKADPARLATILRGAIE